MSFSFRFILCLSAFLKEALLPFTDPKFLKDPASSQFFSPVPGHFYGRLRLRLEWSVWFTQGARLLDALGFFTHMYVRKLLGILYSFQFFQYVLADMMLQILSDNLEALFVWGEWVLFSSLSSLGQSYKAIDFSVSKEAFLLCLSTFLGKLMYLQTRVHVRSPLL